MPEVRYFFAVAALFVVACSGQGGGGCGALSDIPGGRYSGQKTDNAVNLRLTSEGINHLNANWRELVETYAPGGRLTIPLSCSMMGGQGSSFLHFADQGTAGCTSETCGRGDSRCTTDPASPLYDAPVDLTVDIVGFNLLQRAPDTVEVSLSLALQTGDIIVGAACATCAVSYDASKVAPNINTFRAKVKLLIDTKWDRVLAIDVPELDGTQICGSVGSPSRPFCLEKGDLTVSALPGSGLCDDLACTGVEWFKDSVLQLISPFLQDVIRDTIKKQACEPCQTQSDCPDLPGGATSSCDYRKVCMDDATDVCVPRFFGVEGRLSPGVLLAKYGAPPDAQVDLSVAAGSTAQVDTSILVGSRAGFHAFRIHPCVVPASAPPSATVPAPDFDAVLPSGSYHAAISLSQPFLNQAFHHLQQSGSLCVGIDSTTVGSLNSSLLKTFLPSIGPLAERDGKPAPIRVVLRPQTPPRVAIGEGTVDPVSNKAIKPLLKLELADLGLDFYAQVDDRFVRLFSITADVVLPLSFILDDCSSVRPALGDLTQLVTRVKTVQSELLAEDPKVLGDLVPVGLGMAEPILATALTAFELPAAGRFQLKINTLHGVSPVPNTDEYYHLGMFGELVPAGATCSRTDVTGLSARVRRIDVPPPEQLKLLGKPLAWPEVEIAVGADESDGPVHYSYRVDEGFWTGFAPATSEGTLRIRHPALLLQGTHRISVRARSGEYGGSTITEVPVTVDWEGPELALRPVAGARKLRLEARDAISPRESLAVSYRLGDGGWTPGEPGQTWDLEALEDRDLTIQVRDAAGNARELVRKGTVVGAPVAAAPAGGCSTTPASGGWMALPGLALWLRRRVKR